METSATILHADLDAFYASVEQLLDPSLRGKPIAVGGGVVLAASYEAKAFGISGGMSGRRARELCPQLIFVGGHFKEYQRLGDAAINVLNDFTPLVKRISIDEAFADVVPTAMERARRPAEDLNAVEPDACNALTDLIGGQVQFMFAGLLGAIETGHGTGLHTRGVEYVPTMIDIDGKPFATALVGVVTLATAYVAEVTDWALLALPLSVMVGHYLAFRSPAEPARRAPVRATEPIALKGSPQDRRAGDDQSWPIPVGEPAARYLHEGIGPKK
jgi:impB/mucB/samB family